MKSKKQRKNIVLYLKPKFSLCWTEKCVVETHGSPLKKTIQLRIFQQNPGNLQDSSTYQHSPLTTEILNSLRNFTPGFQRASCCKKLGNWETIFCSPWPFKSFEGFSNLPFLTFPKLTLSSSWWLSSRRDFASRETSGRAWLSELEGRKRGFHVDDSSQETKTAYAAHNSLRNKELFASKHQQC